MRVDEIPKLNHIWLNFTGGGGLGDWESKQGF